MVYFSICWVYCRSARTKPVIEEPDIIGGIPIDSSCRFLILMSDGLYKSLELATFTDHVNSEIASFVVQEFAVQSTLNGVAQAVVDKVVRVHHDIYMTASDHRKHLCQQRDDITFLVRNFNQPLPNSVNSPTSGVPYATPTVPFMPRPMAPISVMIPPPVNQPLHINTGNTPQAQYKGPITWTSNKAIMNTDTWSQQSPGQNFTGHTPTGQIPVWTNNTKTDNWIMQNPGPSSFPTSDNSGFPWNNTNTNSNIWSARNPLYQSPPPWNKIETNSWTGTNQPARYTSQVSWTTSASVVNPGTVTDQIPGQNYKSQVTWSSVKYEVTGDKNDMTQNNGSVPTYTSELKVESVSNSSTNNVKTNTANSHDISSWTRSTYTSTYTNSNDSTQSSSGDMRMFSRRSADKPSLELDENGCIGSYINFSEFYDGILELPQSELEQFETEMEPKPPYEPIPEETEGATTPDKGVVTPDKGATTPDKVLDPKPGGGKVAALINCFATGIAISNLAPESHGPDRGTIPKEQNVSFL